MTITQLQQLLAAQDNPDIAALITRLKANRTLPDVDVYKKEFLVEEHDSVNKQKRPDRPVKDPDGNVLRYEKTNRIGIAMQELITERAVSFLFGSPVKIICEPKGTGQETVLGALNRIYKDNKIDSFNAEIALEMFKSKEVAECWFPVEKDEHDDYGFKTKFKLRVMAFDPWEGNELYPLFDDTGDLIAFSRSFEIKDDENKVVVYFETYTDTEKIVWINQGGSWSESSRQKNVIGKIPIVFGKQKQVEWATVQIMIDRLEWLLSNYGDTNDYHASPTIFTTGKIMSMPEKGRSNKLIQGDKDAKAEYLSWNQAPEMVKLEIETLFRLIYSISQTPDISFEAVKGLGEISGVALKMLFLDAHLKVKKKQRVFDAYLERRNNIVKAYIGTFNKELSTDVRAIHIESHIQPFIVDDESAMIERLMTANGNYPLISQRTAIKLSGLVDDVETEYADIKAEDKVRRTMDVSEPTI